MLNKLHFKVFSFSELTTEKLYDILKLRSEVFVVEQNCVYQDIDDKDQKALHVLGYKNEQLIAYTRLFKQGDYFKNCSIGRVVIKKNQRKFGYGRDLVKFSIETIKQHFNTTKITISAQLYLKKFYESFGFIKQGDPYLEDGILHIKMNKNS